MTIPKHIAIVDNKRPYVIDEFRDMTMPKHIAIIMDGNRRYANLQQLSLYDAYISGFQKAIEIIKYCRTHLLSIRELSLFTFSTDNWKRSEMEIAIFNQLFFDILSYKKKDIYDCEARFNFIGDLSKFSLNLIALLPEIETQTHQYHNLKVNIMLNIGGREDILHAVNSADLKPVDAKKFQAFMLSKDVNDIDLLIRTGNRKRISNFLLWQLAYSEIYFCAKMWPDFAIDDFHQALHEYNQSVRTFGK